MKNLKDRARRARCILGAVVVFAATAAPLFLSSSASAGQISTRSILISNSAISATGVSYTVTFTPTVSGTVGGIAVDFCGNSPIIGGTTCTYPAGFTMGATPSVAITSGLATGGSWVTTSSEQGGAAGGATQTLLFTNTTAQAVTNSTPVIFVISGVTNTSALGSFYARVVTFDTSAHAIAQYTDGAGNATTTRPASYANQIDYGGFALSTANVISVTATVMETLTFCVSAAAPAAGCTSTTTPSLTIGHGTPQVIDSTVVDTTPAYTQISTNANGGVIVVMKTGNTCTGLSRDGGTTCPIPGIGAFATIPALTADYGLNVANGTGGSGTVTANANYGPTAATYGMGANVATATGDAIESTTGACSSVNSTLTFAAQAATVTPAGVYSANETLIATGKF